MARRISTHAHFDHAGGIAALQRLSGARVLSSETGALALRAGDLQPDDPQFAFGHDNRSFPAVPDAVAVADGYELTVGDLVLRGVYTPGHTPGGMSWTWRSCEGARCLHIVYADSLGAVAAPGYKFSAGLGEALRNSIDTIAELDCDILLVTHPFVFDFQAKAARGREAFVGGRGCTSYAASAMQQLQRRLSIEATEAASKRSR
jgi:metallo-beta-lactamase class B